MKSNVFKCCAIASIALAIQAVPISAQKVYEGEKPGPQKRSESNEKTSLASSGDTVEKLILMQFEEADENGDGMLSMPEFKGISAFGQSKSDSKQHASSSELESAKQDSRGIEREDGVSRLEKQGERLEERFRELDKDNDGSLSKEEFSNALIGIVQNLEPLMEKPPALNKRRLPKAAPSLPQRIAIPPSNP